MDQMSSIMVTQNKTSLALHWSPPFLWPGHVIVYYNIFIINKTDGSTMHHGINATFDIMMSLPINIGDQQRQSCTELLFVITAIDNNFSFLHQSFNVTERIQSSENCKMGPQTGCSGAPKQVTVYVYCILCIFLVNAFFNLLS